VELGIEVGLRLLGRLVWLMMDVGVHKVVAVVFVVEVVEVGSVAVVLETGHRMVEECLCCSFWRVVLGTMSSSIAGIEVEDMKVVSVVDISEAVGVQATRECLNSTRLRP